MRQSGGQRYRRGYDAAAGRDLMLAEALHRLSSLEYFAIIDPYYRCRHPCRKDIRMIAAEMKNEVSTVRIHDEYYVSEPRGYIAQLNQIVSNSYKRRMSARLTPTNCQPDSVDSLP